MRPEIAEADSDSSKTFPGAFRRTADPSASLRMTCLRQVESEMNAGSSEFERVGLSDQLPIDLVSENRMVSQVSLF
jgi:hypothetical protein